MNPTLRLILASMSSMFFLLINVHDAKAAESSDLILAKPYFHMEQSEVILEAFSRIVRMGDIAGGVSLNEVGDAKFRFFLIDTDQATRDGIDRIGNVSIDQIKNNFLVDRDGDIFIGFRYISLILLNAYNDVLGLAQSHRMIDFALNQGKSEEFLDNIPYVMSSVSDTHRISLIRSFGAKSDNEFSPFNLAVLSIALVGMLELEDLYVFSFAPIVLHEIGHIKTGSQGFFLRGLLDDYIKSEMHKNEKEADDFAIEKLKILLENYTQKTNINQFVYNVQATRATLKLLRDQVYFDAFEDLRGLSTESYMKRVFYKDCNKEPSTAKYPINSIERIWFVADMKYPILTELEFLEVREGFLNSLNGGTHSHHFSRRQRYGAVISSHAQGVSNGGGYPEVDPAFTAFLENRPKELEIFELEDGIGVSFTEFKQAFNERFIFTEAVNCSSRCWVGRESQGGTTIIEVVGPEENLTEVRLTTRVSLPDEQMAEQRKKYVNNIGYMLRFLLSTNKSTAELSQEQLSESIEASNILRKLTSSRKVALQCGAVTDIYVLGGLLYEIRTINDNGWLQVSVSKR